jgi:hypothetical protein
MFETPRSAHEMTLPKKSVLMYNKTQLGHLFPQMILSCSEIYWYNSANKIRVRAR